MLLSLATLVAFVPQGPGSSSAPVVINEFSHDDSGTDDRDFVELWNRTQQPIDLSNWTVQGEEGSFGATPNGVFTIPPGTILAPGDYLVIGNGSVPNVDLVATPVEWLGENATGSANAPDGVTLRDAQGVVVDGVVWNFAVWTAPTPSWLEGQGLQGGMQLIDALAQPPEGLLTAQRWVDGQDTNDNGADFSAMRWTPGDPNGSLNTVPPIVREDCDGLVQSTLAALFAWSFTPATVFDPAAVQVSTAAVRAFPASPQGGNVVRVQDPTGGGNMLTAQVAPGGDLLFECYALVAPGNPLLQAGEGESWAIGIDGTTDTFAHPLDVPGTYHQQTSLCVGSRSPGITGVAWIAYVGPTQTALYLVDAGNGGSGFTVLGGPIVATAGINDGWRRLRLRKLGNTLVANFGGTFGADDGQRFTATVTPNEGTLFVQYRECILANANMTGLLLDRIEVYAALDASVSFAGTPSPTSLGLPNIGVSGQPVVGNAGFQFTATGMMPNGIAILAVDVGGLLPGVPVPGAPPTLLLYAAPTATAVAFNSPLGVTTFPFPLPPQNALIGTGLAVQWFDLDLALPFPLPFGSSRGCQLLLGNG